MKTQVGKNISMANDYNILNGRFATTAVAGNSIRYSLAGQRQYISLSTLLPMIENLGVDVLTSHSESTDAGWKVELDLKPQSSELLYSQSMQTRFIDTLLAIGRGSIDNDGFNRLVTVGEFDLRACVLLRAIARYLGQINLPFSSAYMESTLLSHADITAAIVEYFLLRFDPSQETAPEALELKCSQLLEQVDEVQSLDQDRILRAYIEVINAIVRSNYFLEEIWLETGRCLSFKLEPKRIAAMPKPVPAYEIFVFGPAVEGVHLRGGKVARGGLRWSERMEDYRTEVLGLVKAQMVKNAVIVPTGAKGGFICKGLTANISAEVKFKTVKGAYSQYIQALLDLTDNRSEEGSILPSRIKKYDGEDSYLVVAADKGTATFSDTANEIALARGFWLGDAFASGGSQGYDHKKMGITARGAWESTKRLFQELGVDTQTTSFRVVGIGDMAGDVFGNGMLLSKKICLIAAFNHQHIFIDPSPDPASSYAERSRIFKLPRSSWADYDPSQLSTGGGVFSRQAKRIQLSKEARLALGLKGNQSYFSPDALIQAILSAPVDLLWNGGIGTYVRASQERDADVGDRANDNLRIAVPQLRCKVVVEGGNLGLTQAARIEFAARGGLITTDAVDNSGGVDCSDHEVNIKILLKQLVNEKKITHTERNRLLDHMTDEVSELVLRNNYQQSKMLSQSSHTAPLFMAKHAQLMQILERTGRLDRQLECLPDDSEIEARTINQQGLTRPEIAVLLAYTKRQLFERLVAVDLFTDPRIAQELFKYFPTVLQYDFPETIPKHPLKREILAALMTNEVINQMGATFCLRLLEEPQLNPMRWLQSYIIASEALGIQQLVDEIDHLNFGLDNAAKMDLQLQIHYPLEKASYWLLENADWTMDTQSLIQLYQKAVASTRQQLKMPSQTTQAKVKELEYLYHAFDIANLALASEKTVDQASSGFFEFNQQLELFWLRNQIDSLPAFDSWQRKAKQILVKDLERCVNNHVAHLISKPNPETAATQSDKGNPTISRFKELLSEVRAQSNQHLAMMVYLVRSLEGLKFEG